jgi:hypothetical protein
MLQGIVDIKINCIHVVDLGAGYCANVDINKCGCRIVVASATSVDIATRFVYVASLLVAFSTEPHQLPLSCRLYLRLNNQL